MYYGFYYDWTYILVLIGVVLSLFASSQVKGTFAKYSKIRSYSGMTGREAAEQILRRNGIYDVQVTHIAGNLTDHYDPRNKTLALSDPVYNSTSVAAIGVAAPIPLRQYVWQHMSVVMQYSILKGMHLYQSVGHLCRS